MECVTAVLTRFALKYKVKPDSFQMKVGGYDRRKEKFIGSIQMEYFAWEDGEGSRCVMNRQTVSTLLFDHRPHNNWLAGKPHGMETTLEGDSNVSGSSPLCLAP